MSGGTFIYSNKDQIKENNDNKKDSISNINENKEKCRSNHNGFKRHSLGGTILYNIERNYKNDKVIITAEWA